MLVVGIDPGTRFLGWGVVRCEGNRLTHIAHGVIRAGETAPLSARLLRLDAGLVEVFTEYQPEQGSVETLFFHKDPQAASKLGHARGVVLLALERANIPFGEYAPARIKSMLTGSGRASKSQVAEMVKTLLGLAEVPPSDAADALAIAVTHIRRAPLEARLKEQQARNPALAEALKRASSRRRGSAFAARPVR